MKLTIVGAVLAAVLGIPGGAKSQQCPDFTAERQPFFGDLHVHTAYSWDAVTFGTTKGPLDAYDFARQGLSRPLNFAAVTDHSEGFGLVGVCSTPGGPGYDSPECQVMRGESPLPSEFKFIVAGASTYNATGPVVCREPGVSCDQAADDSVWAKIRAAAAENYAPCQFTSFVAYEWTEQQFDAHLHRNVIFRNEHVPAAPVTALDTHGADLGVGNAPRLWALLRDRCLDLGNGCDVLTIPHNPNLSRGQTFVDPTDAQEARDRQVFEPLVEIMQHKGASECRFDAHYGRGLDTADELCAFEQLPQMSEFIPPQPVIDHTGGLPPEAFPRRSVVRNVLEDGLALEQRGFVDVENPLAIAHVNPFKVGFIGSTDTHSATPGATDERGVWNGHQGPQDNTPALRLGSSITRNPGGLAVVWAEENTRDSIFDALRRRETYGTSGTRPTVRFFGGWNLAADLCDQSASLVTTAYRDGVAMGSDLREAPAGATAPKFVTWALRDSDPGGNALQRVQIIKGWVDAGGHTHEAIYDVAPGNPSTSREVDPATCRATETGSPELCSVWTDPSFDPKQPAVYYARILEEPSCRWSVYDCRTVGVDPFAANCSSASHPECCPAKTDPVTQERAWTSPIWYRPPYS